MQLSVHANLTQPNIAGSQAASVANFQAANGTSVVTTNADCTAASILRTNALIRYRSKTPLHLDRTLLLNGGPQVSLFSRVHSAALTRPRQYKSFSTTTQQFSTRVRIFSKFTHRIRVSTVGVRQLLNNDKPGKFQHAKLQDNKLAATVERTDRSRAATSGGQRAVPPLAGQRPPLAPAHAPYPPVVRPSC